MNKAIDALICSGCGEYAGSHIDAVIGALQANVTALQAERDAALRREDDANRASFAHMRRADKAEADLATSVARAEAAEGRYVALRQWFLNELPRSEIAPFGHIQHTTPEVVDQWCDKVRALTPPADLTQEKPHE
jgi:hypothetical protein